MMGLSTSGSISLGCALVAGRKRVPSPAAGNTALRTRIFMSEFQNSEMRNSSTMVPSETPKRSEGSRPSRETFSAAGVMPVGACRIVAIGIPRGSAARDYRKNLKHRRIIPQHCLPDQLDRREALLEEGVMEVF